MIDRSLAMKSSRIGGMHDLKLSKLPLLAYVTVTKHVIQSFIQPLV